MIGPALSSVAIPRSHEWELTHQAGDRLRVMLAWPEPPPPPAGYPVFCVLDGGTTFGTATETARLQAGRPAATGVRPAVILGLELATRDPATRQRLYAPGVNGAAALLRLLETTVLPQAAKIVPLDRSDMALFGHSLAGLVPLHALFEGGSSFSRLIAASPSLWWDDEALLQRARGFAASAPPPLLLTVGGLERADRLPAGTEPGRVERVAARRMAENVHALAGMLSPMMAVEVIEFPGENHGSSLPGALARAVAFALGRRGSPAT